MGPGHPGEAIREMGVVTNQQDDLNNQINREGDLPILRLPVPVAIVLEDLLMLV